MSRPARRGELFRQIEEALRKVSAQSVLMSDTVASRVGLNSTDLECLDLLHLHGPAAAGTLAAHTGLTTGAMTAVLDRLERAGFARRRRDPRDRRRVLVEALPAGIRLIEPFYARLAVRMTELNTAYTDRDLAAIVDYMSRAIRIGADHIAWLQTQPMVRHRRRPGRARTRPRRGERPAPSGAAAAGAADAESGVRPGRERRVHARP